MHFASHVDSWAWSHVHVTYAPWILKLISALTEVSLCFTELYNFLTRNPSSFSKYFVNVKIRNENESNLINEEMLSV